MAGCVRKHPCAPQGQAASARILPEIEIDDAGRSTKFAFQPRDLSAPGDTRFIMGDKSPKATNKQAAQKQAKANSNTQKKQNAAAAKQPVKPKK
jgi:hypothetical protein